MKQIAINKARERLGSARGALKRMRTARQFEQGSTAWTELLVALNAIFSVLEKGARGDGKSQAWISREHQKRKEADLLKYLHQARNADEHGLEPIMELKPGAVGISTTSGSFQADLIHRDSRGNIHMVNAKDPKGGKIIIGYRPPEAKLVPVINRGITYLPPAKHFDHDLSGKTPSEIAEIAIDYHAELIELATKYVTSDR